MTEIWKEYKTYYRSGRIRSNFMVSNFGNVKGELYNDKKLEITINKKGRRCLSNAHSAQIFILVWTSFNGPIPKGYCVHHIDENKLNDRLDNLMLLTNAEHMSLHKKGKRMSEEFKNKISEIAKNRAPMSDETKRKISIASTGRKHTDETKRKISKANKGKHLSEEGKQKISKANKGRKTRLGAKLSDETKMKISQSLKGNIPWNKGLKINKA